MNPLETCPRCGTQYVAEITVGNHEDKICYGCEKKKKMTERNYTCAFCEKWPFKSLAALMDHERDCKIRKSENRAERSISSLLRSDTVPVSSVGSNKKPWWKSTGDEKKKKLSSSTAATTNGNYQRFCSHYNWVNVGGGYKVLALSSNNKQRLMASKDAEYFVALAETYLSPGEVLTNFDSRLNTSHGLKIIRVIWPDMGTISAADYNRLVDYLVNLLKAGKRVAVGCLGAHGRTGSVLAGIILRLEGCTGVQAVQRVRERHCSLAVESQAQERLVANKEIDQTIANLQAFVPMVSPIEEQYTTLFDDEDFETVVVDSQGNPIDDLWEN